MKSTKKSLVGSALVLLLCLVMLVGTTFAWFTDSVTSGNNKIIAGNLKVDLIHVDDGKEVSIKDNPSHKIFDYDKWEPGYTVMETLKVVNKGNLALKFRLDAVAAGATTGPTGEKLADVIDVWVYEGEGIPTTKSFAEMTEDANWRNAGSLSTLMADPDGIARGVLLPEEATPTNGEPVKEVQMTVALHMQESAGNAYQGLTLGDLNFTLMATQYTYEEDAFDDQYDAGAKYAIKVGNANELEEAIEQGQAVTLTGNITVDQIPLNEEGATNIDLNGHELTSSEYASLTVASGAELNISGGTLSIGDDKTWTNIAQAAIVVQGDSSVTLTNVNYSAAGTGVFAQGENATVNIIDSTIESPAFCVGTNAGNQSNYGVNIRIVNSNLSSTHRDGWTGSAVLMNVPGNLTIENSTIIGECNAVIVRGGTATIKDSVLSRPYEVEGTTESEIHMNDDWGSGNNVPLATLLLGNRSSNAYQYPTVCTVENTKITADADGAKAVYLYGNSDAANGVTFEYDEATTIQSGAGVADIVYGGGYVSINGEVQEQQP